MSGGACSLGHPLLSKQLPVIVPQSSAANSKCCLVPTKVLSIISRLCPGTDSRLTISLLTPFAFSPLILPYPLFSKIRRGSVHCLDSNLFQIGLRVTSSLSGKCQSTLYQGFEQRELPLVVNVSFEKGRNSCRPPSPLSHIVFLASSVLLPDVTNSPPRCVPIGVNSPSFPSAFSSISSARFLDPNPPSMHTCSPPCVAPGCSG